MPYIVKQKRKKLDSWVNGLIDRCSCAGDITYCIYRLLIGLVARQKKYGGLKYNYLAGLLGCVTSAREEFYRRIVVPYEDAKIEENGDVEIK